MSSSAFGLQRLLRPLHRNLLSTGGKVVSRDLNAVAVGCYEGLKSSDVSLELTSTGSSIDSFLQEQIRENLTRTNFKAKPGNVRTLHGLHPDYPCVIVTGLGSKECQDENEEIDQEKENARIAAGAAISTAKEFEAECLQMDGFSQPSAAAEGVQLRAYSFDTFKSKSSKWPEVQLLENNSTSSLSLWKEGMLLADGQNVARELMEMPSNFKYPAALAEMITDILSFGSKNLTVTIRNKDWIVDQNMGGVLGVAQGSVHEPRFLEIEYNGSVEEKPTVLVGKGVTFDSGGISIKPSQAMGLMRGDMGGAACVVGAVKTAVQLELPLRLIALIPLCENMPSGSALRPGDVVKAMNGKTIEVDNTDAEGRLILADALCYAHSFEPSMIVDVATLTGAIDVALGAGATGFYTTSGSLWRQFHKAGQLSGDRMWRLPVFKYYSKQMDCSNYADIRNTQKKARSAGSCTAAAFLKEFVEINEWAHLDIAGVMTNEGDVPYLGRGMSGRPTRTLVEALRSTSSR